MVWWNPSSWPWLVVTDEGAVLTGAPSEVTAEQLAQEANDKAEALGIVTRYSARAR